MERLKVLCKMVSVMAKLDLLNLEYFNLDLPVIEK